ncbi:glycosyltransferase family 4 protein [Thermomonas fusca]|nr:glycosyltransferase family 4 protein [Thermomonas fusca]
MSTKVEQTMSSGDVAWLSSLMRDGGIAHQMRNGGVQGKLRSIGLLFRLRQLYQRVPALDVRHVNWLQNALVIPSDNVPLLATVLGSDMKLLQLPGMGWAMRRIFRRHRTVIAPNAQWMVPELVARFGGDAEVQYVPFGIDPSWFEVRRDSVEPMDWVCVSRVTEAKVGKLLTWFQALALRGERLHLFGPMQEAVSLPDWVTFHGPVTAAELRERWFGLACGLITLSQHAEGRPQVMLEAMAAGLPIIASAIPAHIDLLQHGITGWLCHEAADVEQGVAELSDPEVNRRIGKAARQWCRTHVGTWDDCAGRYVDLYRYLAPTTSS